ncbi:type ISP restriction/modification enzyme [Methylosinus sp. C49]|uniref:type ISP restriction/modification enzyme n=1 Tax=Methylosinus sp. C49 TaxID=2699395 RepID=UPI00137B2649|nr:type ISP restriction/modification enzyme [Methylosinus sp. C49]
MVARAGMILGYVEVKEIGENLDKILKTDQIKRYCKLSDNIIVSDYLQFLWIDKTAKLRARAVLAFPSDLESRKLRVDPQKAAEVGKLLSAFFSTAPQGVAHSEQLAIELATRARLLRDFLEEELLRQSKEHREGRLHALYEVFRQQVFHELELKEFADAFAQMLAYGLFLARLNADANEKVTLENVRRFIPGSFRLIRELVRFLEEMNEAEYEEARWVVDEILSIVNGLDLTAVHSDLSFRRRKAISRKVRAQDEEEHRLFERDPFIYFYEDFLKAYDKETRKARGVYYTPPPIVNFIVRAVDDILKSEFGIADGLADHERVTVLDFACGTGTFLLEVFERIFETIGGADVGKAKKVVREHILRNIFGFEYLIAPYTIAHLKLSQYLKDKGHELHADERLQVFLTNTLEPVEPQANLLLPAITEEVKAAQQVKDQKILVITGNPPYSGHSRNKGAWISQEINSYKFTIEADADGREFKKPLGERNLKWLNDDYVKFIRFAQAKMDAVDEGVVGIITNHSWLDNPTFRGMRQSLMRSFNRIIVIDLHGSIKPKELPPGGARNENVFDIQKGVALSFFIKRSGMERGIWRSDIWGTRLEKYSALAIGTLESAHLSRLHPTCESYLFAYQNAEIRTQYECFTSVREIFETASVGVATARDALTIHFQRKELLQTIDDFSSRETEDARETYRLGTDAEDWKVMWAQQDIRSATEKEKHIVHILYRPFDVRWTFYTGKSNGFHCRPRAEAMRHMRQISNLALITSRLTKGENFRHVQITEHISEVICMSPETSNNGFLFPLYKANDAKTGVENFKPDFRDDLDARYRHHYSPEEILGYIYAVLHAPTYRTRYAEFLRLDFPRIPFPEKAVHFEALSALGWALVQVHLLRDLPRRKLGQLVGKGEDAVEFVRYSEAEKAVAINGRQSFRPVPEEVWNFHIGGYQVIDKYLKSRKGRTLSLDEIRQVERICDALSFTIDQMAAIDRAYLAAFPDAETGGKPAPAPRARKPRKV